MWKYYNPNPTAKKQTKHWTKQDCGVRAVCKATGLDWVEALKKLCDAALEVYDVPTSDTAIERTLENFGFVKHSYKKGVKRETVKEFCKAHKGTAILRLAGHVVCCSDGDYFDTWDCGNKTAYCYYTKDTK